MTLAPTQLTRSDAADNPTQPGHRAVLSSVTSDGLEAMATFLVRNLPADDDRSAAVARRLVIASIQSFVAHNGLPDHAARRMAPALWELGSRHAQRGYDIVVLDEIFRRARQLGTRGLQFAVCTELPASTARALRGDVLRFIQLLEQHARCGWRQFSGGTMNGQIPDRTGAHAPERTQRSDAPFVDGTETGQHAEDPYRLVVSVPLRPLPSTFGPHRVIRGQHPNEVLVPESMSLDDLARMCPVQVVIGPVAPLYRQAEHAQVVRRGAALLREGATTDDRRVVPCIDLSTSLVSHGLPGLPELLMAKHLGPLESLSRERRLREGELLLHWLRLGHPVNQLARDLGIPPQTAHSRLAHLRELFGDALEDPTQRLELILALQSALPRWRLSRPAKRARRGAKRQ